MFPLNTDTFPASATELARRLNESLRGLFGLSRDPVEIHAKSYPHLESLVVSLDGAVLPERPPAMPSVASSPEPALTIDSFRVNASPLSVGPALVDFQLVAQGVDLHRAIDRSGHLLLLLHNAANGRVEIAAAVSDLETLIAQVAKAEAGRHGVNIESVQLSLRSRSSRSLAAEVRLRAKKLFVSASLRITGQLDLDEQLNARISGLDCTGDGAIASVACGILKPHLQKLDGREFSLLSLPLGEVRLRDVRIAVGEKLSVNAEFGSAA
ncbi:MAG TPA: hypothetical protein VE031_10020 [Chthoniobacterales bacterium]|nr:hypothetical protein [Chthoniobacterales bacterium]